MYTPEGRSLYIYRSPRLAYRPYELSVRGPDAELVHRKADLQGFGYRVRIYIQSGPRFRLKAYEIKPAATPSADAGKAAPGCVAIEGGP